MDEEQKGSKKVGRIELLVLILVFMSPVLGAWFIYAYTDIGRGENISHGELLEPPVLLKDVSLHSPANGSEAGNLLGKLSLIYILPDNCEKACFEEIDMLQKLKMSLAKNSHRLQLIVAHKGRPGTITGSGLAPRIDWGDILAMSATDKTGLTDFAENELFLMDPAGNLMMRYNEGSSGAGILQDIKQHLH